MAAPKAVAPRPAAARKAAPAPSVDNRRARYEYELLERVEAGIVLTGTEIKSVRTGRISIAEAYARVRDGELWLLGMHVPPYKEGSFSNVEPNRPRKLLLHRREIERLGGRAGEKGLTLVPTRLYFKRGRVKIELALARGKKIWDKRRTEREREAVRDLQRAVRER
ncbi:MAG: SsrA-binding protein SmpB [Vulcanimicrobiaceae bacterium]